MDLRALECARTTHYHISPAHRIRTLAQAARYIDRRGMCWLFAPRDRTLELPSLFEAVKGKRNVHIDDWDDDSDRLWAWRSDLPAARRAYYGKALAGKPVFISLELLPAVLAALGEDDFRARYANGGVSYDAKRVYDALEQFGPQPTLTLRRRVGLDSKDGGVRFHRALDELQRRLVVTPMGAANESGAWVSQVFDLLARWFPEQAAAARHLDLHSARLTLIERYVQNVLAAPMPTVARLFAVPRAELESLVAELVAQKRMRVQDSWLLSPRYRPERQAHSEK